MFFSGKVNLAQISEGVEPCDLVSHLEMKYKPFVHSIQCLLLIQTLYNVSMTALTHALRIL